MQTSEFLVHARAHARPDGISGPPDQAEPLLDLASVVAQAASRAGGSPGDSAGVG